MPNKSPLAPKALSGIGSPDVNPEGTAIRLDFRDKNGRSYMIVLSPEAVSGFASHLEAAVGECFRRQKKVDPAATIGLQVEGFSVGGSDAAGMTTLTLQLPSTTQAVAMEFLLRPEQASTLGQALSDAADRLSGRGATRQ